MHPLARMQYARMKIEALKVQTFIELATTSKTVSPWYHQICK